MQKTLPKLAIVLGFAGLMPFVATASVSLGPAGGNAALALTAYGAVILAFLGGVHWGFALSGPDVAGERERLALGVVPSLVGWLALLLAIAIRVEAGLALLVAGFLATTSVEARAARRGLMPPGYLALRYGLTAVVVVVLTVVLVMRVAGLQWAS